MFFAMLCSVTTMAKKEKNEPVAVIITAGQSNTDGRVMNSEFAGVHKKQRFQALPLVLWQWRAVAH